LTVFDRIAINTELQADRSTATFWFLIIVYSTGDHGSPQVLPSIRRTPSVESMFGLGTAGANPRR
jgi:hypothetical protein